MARVFIDADLDYVDGYLMYGHKEGVVNIPDEDIMEGFKRMDKALAEVFAKQPLKQNVSDALSIGINI